MQRAIWIQCWWYPDAQISLKWFYNQVFHFTSQPCFPCCTYTPLITRGSSHDNLLAWIRPKFIFSYLTTFTYKLPMIAIWKSSLLNTTIMNAILTLSLDDTEEHTNVVDFSNICLQAKILDSNCIPSKLIQYSFYSFLRCTVLFCSRHSSTGITFSISFNVFLPSFVS